MTSSSAADITVFFDLADGQVIKGTGQAGESLLSVAQTAGVPLEGSCEGQMACSTCHIRLSPEVFSLTPAACEEEEELLDLAAGLGPTSRLACQITLDAQHDGMRVAVPAASRNVMGL